MSNSRVVDIMNALPSPVAALFRAGGIRARMLRPLVDRLVPDHPTQVVVLSGPGRGLRLLIHPRHEKYYWTGLHEEHVQSAIADALTPGMSFWDIGAHVGFFALLASRLGGDTVQVHAFEPMPGNFDRLKTNIEANALSNIQPHCVALSDEVGSSVFMTTGSSLTGHLAQGKGEATEGTVRVNTVTIDSIASDSGGVPDLLKIDVEGAEGRVIRGAARTIQACRPHMIIEVHSAQAGRDVVDALPVPYLFHDITSGQEAALPLAAGHYFGRAAVGFGHEMWRRSRATAERRG